MLRVICATWRSPSRCDHSGSPTRMSRPSPSRSPQRRERARRQLLGDAGLVLGEGLDPERREQLAAAAGRHVALLERAEARQRPSKPVSSP